MHARAITGANTVIIPNGLDENAVMADFAREKLPVIQYPAKNTLDFEHNPQFGRHLARQVAAHELAHTDDPSQRITQHEGRIREAGSDIAAYVVNKYLINKQIDILKSKVDASGNEAGV